MTVKPTFFKSIFLINFKLIFIVILHYLNHITHIRKPHMKQSFHIKILYFNYIFSVFSKRCASYLFSSKNLNNNILTRIFCYFFESLIHLFSSICIYIICTCSKSHKSIRMNSYHITIYFIILLPSSKKMFSYFHYLGYFLSFFIDNKQ